MRSLVGFLAFLLFSHSAWSQSAAYSYTESADNGQKPMAQPAYGQSHPGAPTLLPREADPIFIGATVGNPAPSWIGGRLGFQLGSAVEVYGAVGYFRYEEIYLVTYGAGARVYILPTRLSPFVGGQVTFFQVGGFGKFQGLDDDSNLVLPGISLGLDFISSIGLRTAAGFSFQFPVKLVFPFFELGFSF